MMARTSRRRRFPHRFNFSNAGYFFFLRAGDSSWRSVSSFSCGRAASSWRATVRRLLRGPAPGFRVTPRRRRGGGRGARTRLLGRGLRRGFPGRRLRAVGLLRRRLEAGRAAGFFAGLRRGAVYAIDARTFAPRTPSSYDFLAAGFFFLAAAGGPLPVPARSRARSSRLALSMGSS